MKDIGICFGPASGLSIGQLIPLAQKAEIVGFGSIWTGEFGNDSLTWAQALAQATRHCRIGTSITNIYLRHPTITAAAAATIDELSGSRFVLGLGTSHRSIVEDSLGLMMTRPLDYLEAYHRIIRTTLSEEQVQDDGEFFHIKGFRLQARPAGVSKLPIYVATLGLTAAKRAAQYADGLILTLTPPGYEQKLISIVQNSAEAAGRDPNSLEIIHILPCFPADDEAAAEKAARRMICRYVAMPFYGNMFVKAGFDIEVKAIREALEAQQMQKAEQSISRKMIDAVAAIGNFSSYRQAIERHQAAGTQVALYPNAVTSDNPIAWQDAIKLLLEQRSRLSYGH